MTQSPFGSFLGTLNANGGGSASLTLPPGLAPTLAEMTVHHAYAVMQTPGRVSFASNAVPLTLVP